MTLGYGVCVGWWTEFTDYVVPHTGDYAAYTAPGQPLRPVIAVSGQTSIAVAYNMIVRAFLDMDVDAVVLMHTDLQITDPAFEDKVAAVLAEPGVGLVGVAGGGGSNGTAWWTDNPIGHQQTDGPLLDFGVRSGDVDVLEGSLLVFSRWAMFDLRFDEEMPGFHGYDEICLRARRAGMRCVVADIDTHHHTTAGRFRSEQSRRDWHTANARSLEDR